MARHARATKVTVSLRCTVNNVTLLIQDNGRGFDFDKEKRSGIGIVGMRERAQLLGGEFNIQTAPGAGTQIRVSIPPMKEPKESDGKAQSAACG